MLTTAESNKEYKAIQDKLESDEVALHSARIEIETITKQKLLMEQENQKLMKEINMTNTKLSNMLTERESLQRHAEELSKSISFLSDKFQSTSHNSSNQNADLVLSENQLLKSKIMQQDAELKSLKLNQTELLEALSSQMRALEQAELSEIDHQRSQARVDALITSMELQYNNVVAKSIATEQSAIVRVKELEKQLQELISQSKLDRSNSSDYHEKDQQLKSLHVQLKEAKGLLNLTTEALSLGSYM
jgi:chromosome segregation ATPase